MKLTIPTKFLAVILTFCTVLLLAGCHCNHYSDNPPIDIETAREYDSIALQYDFVEEQKRLAEYYYQKAYNLIKEDPSQDWWVYGDAGYRYACLIAGRGNLKESLVIVNDMLSVVKNQDDFPKKYLSSLYMQLASCQKRLGQLDDARKNYIKAYQIDVERVGGECQGTYSLFPICANLFLANTEGYFNKEEAERWLNRCFEELYAYEKTENIDSRKYEEYAGLYAVYRAELLLLEGHPEEANAAFDSIPKHLFNQYYAPASAVIFLINAERYADAADLLNMIDTTFVRDSIIMSLDMFRDYLAPRYEANRRAGHIDEALNYADIAFQSIDSAIVWQERNEAVELSIIYETHQKEMALEESKAQARINRILLDSAILVIILIVYLLIRAIHFNRTLAEKNRKLYEEIEQKLEEQQQEMKMLQATPETELSSEQKLYRRLCTLMDEQKPYTDENMNRDMLAQQLGTNAKYVEQSIRQCSKGETVSDFINRYRLEQIAFMLKTTDDPVAIIGEQCGIPSRATLARLFRNFYGMTPTEYRAI